MGNHQVLVLIGKQGIFKTTWLEHPIPPALLAYCCKLANTTQINKDDRLRLAEFGLINLDDIATLEEHNESFRAQESEEQLQPILFDVPAEGRGEFTTTAQISERLVTYGNIKKPMPLNRLGVLMGQLGFKNIRAGKQRICGWPVYQYSPDEIKSMQKIYAK
jgi:hypothetical protein